MIIDVSPFFGDIACADQVVHAIQGIRKCDSQRSLHMLIENIFNLFCIWMPVLITANYTSLFVILILIAFMLRV